MSHKKIHTIFVDEVSTEMKSDRKFSLQHCGRVSIINLSTIDSAGTQQASGPWFNENFQRSANTAVKFAHCLKGCQ